MVASRRQVGPGPSASVAVVAAERWAEEQRLRCASLQLMFISIGSDLQNPGRNLPSAEVAFCACGVADVEDEVDVDVREELRVAALISEALWTRQRRFGYSLALVVMVPLAGYQSTGWFLTL